MCLHLLSQLGNYTSPTLSLITNIKRLCNNFRPQTWAFYLSIFPFTSFTRVFTHPSVLRAFSVKQLHFKDNCLSVTSSILILSCGFVHKYFFFTEGYILAYQTLGSSRISPLITICSFKGSKNMHLIAHGSSFPCLTCA